MLRGVALSDTAPFRLAVLVVTLMVLLTGWLRRRS